MHDFNVHTMSHEQRNVSIRVSVSARSSLGPLQSCPQDALFICHKQSPDNAHSVAFYQRSNSPRLIEDETFNDSDIMNNLIGYEDGPEEPDSLRAE
ncbi:uncharacterized protein TNCV_110581 [Trichonephila clavipes]|nr:uncharacterized protein TNCV_110581 [Trichonephila clavipes]